MIEQKEFGLPINSQFKHNALDIGSYRGFRQPQVGTDVAWTLALENPRDDSLFGPVQAEGGCNAMALSTSSNCGTMTRRFAHVAMRLVRPRSWRRQTAGARLREAQLCSASLSGPREPTPAGLPPSNSRSPDRWTPASLPPSTLRSSPFSQQRPSTAIDLMNMQVFVNNEGGRSQFFQPVSGLIGDPVAGWARECAVSQTVRTARARQGISAGRSAADRQPATNTTVALPEENLPKTE